MRSNKLFKKGGGPIENILLQCDLIFNSGKITITNKNNEAVKTKATYNKLSDAIFDLLPPDMNDSTEKINKFLQEISKNPYPPVLAKINTSITKTEYTNLVPKKNKLYYNMKSAEITIQPISDDPDEKEISDDPDEKEIIDYLNKTENDANNYLIVIDSINTDTIFDDITTIINNYGEKRKDSRISDKNNEFYDFQSNEFIFSDRTTNDSGKLIKVENKYKDIFGKYQIYNKEDERKFVTIDPSIIQIMIFDEDVKNFINGNDIVYSLKLIKRDDDDINRITLRYTTQLFPNESKINNFNDLIKFNTFNKLLGNKDINITYDLKLLLFLKKYIKFYNFYRKCYTFEQTCPTQPQTNNKLIEYQLKYISILGKARFGDPIIQVRTAVITDYIMSNLLFASPSYAFISGGYKGFKDNKYGVTRSGYEISKRYNRPILTIMCAEGLHDSHEFSDAILIYGEHWGEDSIALSQLTDGAIIIAPFGGWTYIECLTLLANKKIVGIYNDFFNILNYDETVGTTKNENSNFFKFTNTEQKNIINYNINYYLILIYLLNSNHGIMIKDNENFIDCLKFGVQLLSYLKTLLKEAENKYYKVKEAEKLNAVNINEIKDIFSNEITELITIIKNFNILKTTIDNHVKKNLPNINKLYQQKLDVDYNEYQNKIPEKCDGIWIKPLFDLIDKCITIPKTFAGGSKKLYKNGGNKCSISDTDIASKIKQIIISDIKLKEYDAFFNKLNTNIIFVFSDVMYLNIYLNENLNKPSFQQNIQNKINNLLQIKFINEASSETETLKDIINKERNYELILDRKIDGTLDEKTKTITNEPKIRQDYTFKINTDCNNYTTLINVIGKEDLSLENDELSTRVINDSDKQKLNNEYKELQELENIKIAPVLTGKSLSLRDVISSTAIDLPSRLLKKYSLAQMIKPKGGGKKNKK
jgi:hypothetical protein